jgi:hypothetical protein
MKPMHQISMRHANPMVGHTVDRKIVKPYPPDCQAAVYAFDQRWGRVKNFYWKQMHRTGHIMGWVWINQEWWRQHVEFIESWFATHS